MEKGQLITLQMQDMSLDGRAIGKTDGFAIFVSGAVPGDRVEARLTRVKKNYALADAVRILQPSPVRRPPHCPQATLCGGCPYSTLNMEAQLALKTRQVRETLTRLGALQEPVVRPMVGMNEPFSYRNKAVMAVSTGGFLTKKGGAVAPMHEPRIGFYRAGSHTVTDCETCPLQAPPAMAVAAALRRFMTEDHIVSYDPRWGKGLMRHLIVRSAPGTGQVMVILCICGRGIPHAEKLVGLLDEAVDALPVEPSGPYAGLKWSLKSVILDMHREGEALNGPALGGHTRVLAGAPVIEEELGGLRFAISPLSFYQINPRQATRLYRTALDYADLKGGETVLDLYCGVGGVGLFAARELAALESSPAYAGRNLPEGGDLGDLDDPHEEPGSPKVKAEDIGGALSKSKAGTSGGHAARPGHAAGRGAATPPGLVIGIESVPQAIRDANRNAVLNGIVQARYLCGKAEDILPQLLELGRGAVATCGDAGAGRPAAEDAMHGAATSLRQPASSKAARNVLPDAMQPASVDPLPVSDDMFDLARRACRADVAFLDPPRAGCDKRLLTALAAIAPRRIVYISCDPATLARDIRILCEAGYRFEEATPVDMFPWTGAIEVVARLSRE